MLWFMGSQIVRHNLATAQQQIAVSWCSETPIFPAFWKLLCFLHFPVTAENTFVIFGEFLTREGSPPQREPIKLSSSAFFAARKQTYDLDSIYRLIHEWAARGWRCNAEPVFPPSGEGGGRTDFHSWDRVWFAESYAGCRIKIWSQEQLHSSWVPQSFADYRTWCSVVAGSSALITLVLNGIWVSGSLGLIWFF